MPPLDSESSMIRREMGTRNGSYGRVSVFEVRDVLGQFEYYEIELNGQVLEGLDYRITDPAALRSAFLIAQEIAENGLGPGPKPP